MFESVELGRSFSKKEFAAIEPDLRMKLFEAQRGVIENGVPVAVIIAGVDTAGRGETVNMLSEWMDAKGLRNHTFWFETDEEKMRPYAWRFWRTFPSGGETAVYFGGWYGKAVRALKTGDAEAEGNFDRLMHRWVRLEKTLAASGAAVIKIWLHISKRVFKQRIKERLKSRGEIRFTPYEKNTSEDYDDLTRAAARAIRITDRQEAPWHLIDAEDSNYRNAAVASVITSAMNNAVRIKKGSLKIKKAEPEPFEPSPEITALDKMDLSPSVSHEEYKREMERLGGDIRALTYKAYKRGISSTLVFEGWDAAGKGGAIRRLSSSIDARISRVIPISAPTDEELARNYLWRFWRHIPMAGFVTVYDRSWYGRVLVERVDRLASPDDWGRAYAEINDFEEQLTEGGNVLVKFWLHISEEEQLKRFKEREETPWKRYKITKDDWHNREKRKEYLKAADEMFRRTDTDAAPWHIIPAEDKKYARITVMKIYKEALERALKNSRKK